MYPGNPQKLLFSTVIELSQEDIKKANVQTEEAINRVVLDKLMKENKHFKIHFEKGIDFVIEKENVAFFPEDILEYFSFAQFIEYFEQVPANKVKFELTRMKLGKLCEQEFITLCKSIPKNIQTLCFESTGLHHLSAKTLISGFSCLHTEVSSIDLEGNYLGNFNADEIVEILLSLFSNRKTKFIIFSFLKCFTVNFF